MVTVFGQIISLFGNAVLRFALPLFLLSETGSAALFGIVSACAFIPMIVLGPVGGIFADRVNKRNIMVILDFSTALLVLFILCLLGKMDVVALIFTALFILYGIQGAYQPAVQASIPALLSNEHVMQGNAAINMILSALMIIGLPVIVTQLLAFNSETANRLYGYAEGVMAVGSLCGGMGAGMFASLFFIVTVIVVLLAFAMKKPFARLAELFAERKNFITEK